jgi:hypothetical protein
MKDDTTYWMAYGRGVYRLLDEEANSTISDDKVVLVYTGSRWFFSVFEGGERKGREYWVQYSMELHAFWDRLYNYNTEGVSNPTSNSVPMAVDFFYIVERGARYGPLGKLVPAQDPPGSGFFECVSE